MASPASTFDSAVKHVREGSSIQVATQELMASLTTAEKFSILTGPEGFWPGLRRLMVGAGYQRPWLLGPVERVGIPGVRFCDGPRGVVLGESTCFPVAIARGATWDTALEQKVGRVMSIEARAQGANMSGAICINLPRHPAWGRIQETYGEDPILLGEFGLAITKSIQENGLIACVKHFALNSMEDMRFYVDVTIDDAALHEVYLPHFEMVVKEGNVMSVMTAYNSVNGEWCGQNAQLMEQILRKEWGFKYFTISDWVFGLRDSVKSIKNGLDLEAPFSQVRVSMEEEFKSGKISAEDVHRCVSRILSTQLELYSKDRGTDPDKSVVLCKDHRILAREVAARSMVLLKNEPLTSVGDAAQLPLLPIDISTINKCALIGKLADATNTGDWGSSHVNSPTAVTPFAGIKEALSSQGATVSLTASNDEQEAVKAAKQADLAIVVVGYTATEEGENLNAATPFRLIPLPSPTEIVRDLPKILWQQAKERFGFGYAGKGPSLGGKAGGDRKSLRLTAETVNLIRAVKKANPKTVIALIASGAVIMEEWIEQVDTVLVSWYSGCEGGNALADVIFGRVDASGRLPFSIPRDEKDLPSFDASAKKVTYDKWFGQRLLDRKGVPARFPLGYGMSYTTFAVTDLVIERRDEFFDVRVKVKNTGARAGRYVVQVYGKPKGAGEDFPSRVLLGFKPVDLQPSEAQNVHTIARIRPLQRWHSNGFAFAASEVEIEVGAYAGDRAASDIIKV